MKNCVKIWLEMSEEIEKSLINANCDAEVLEEHLEENLLHEEDQHSIQENESTIKQRCQPQIKDELREWVRESGR